MSGTGDGASTARPIPLDNRSDCRLHRWAKHRTVRHFAGCDEFPQRDEQFAGQGDNHRLAGGAALIGGARPIPPRQRAVLLQHQEAPGELQHAAADAGIARPGQGFFSPAGAAFLGRSGQPAITRHSAAVQESTF